MKKDSNGMKKCQENNHIFDCFLASVSDTSDEQKLIDTYQRSQTAKPGYKRMIRGKRNKNKLK